MLTEADTCRKYILPNLLAAGWDNEPHSIAEQRTFSDQRHIVAYLDGLQANVDALKQLQSETAAELDALLPAILDKAFKGEL